MGEGLLIVPGLAIPDNELRWRFSRSGGPGGQSVNTSDTRVELSFDVARSPQLSPLRRGRALERLAGRLVDGVLTVSSETHRSQWANRRAAAERLAEVLRAAVAPPPRTRRPTRPGRGAVERRLSDKRRHAQRKQQRGTPEAE